MQHWTFETIFKVLERLSVDSLVVITNTISNRGPARADWDLERDGRYRPLDVRLSPLNLTCEELLDYDAGFDSKYSPDIKPVLLWRPPPKDNCPNVG